MTAVKLTTGLLAAIVCVFAPVHNAGAQPFLFGASGGGGDQTLTVNGATIFDTSVSQFDTGVDNQGWWSGTAGNANLVDIYFVGDLNGHLHNNFFSFDLTGFSGSVRSAVLSLPRFESDFAGAPSLTYSLFDVSTDAETLNANDDVSAAIFEDLGSGVLFGSLVVSLLSPDPLEIALNADALSAMNDFVGTCTSECFFSIGGTLTPAGQVPEPSSGALLLLAFALGGARLLRSRFGA